MSDDADAEALLQAALSLDLRGSLDAVEPGGRVFGWCWSADEPGLRRPVAILMNGREAARTVADILRDDLLAAGVGDGGHSFVAEIAAALRVPGGAATITICDAATGRRIGGELSVTWADATPDAPKLAGNVDRISRDGWVSGWCWDPAAPERRLVLDVLVDDIHAGRVQAAEARADLRHAEVGDGRYGFNVMLPYELLAERGTVRVRVIEHGTGRALGDPTLVQIGRHGEQDRRLAELERQVALMRGRLDTLADEHARQPDAQAKARNLLFATMADLFQDLADGVPPAALSAGPKGGIGPALSALRRDLPALTLRAPALGTNGRPLATLAVPASASVEQVHACLCALHEAGSDRLADIVLLDPPGSDERCALLPALVANLRVGPSEDGPVAGFARLLREADTRLVGLISPQVRPEPGWLETLAATFDEVGDAALVGAAVLRPDGLRQHAGFVLDADDRLRDLGHLARADEAQHRFLRPVDAVAPLALLADRDRVAASGGLDAAYTELGPAIVALCLTMPANAGDVLLQPASSTVLASPDPVWAEHPDLATEDGVRLHLRLQRHRRQGRGGAGFVAHALVVDAELPVPDRDAGSLAALEQMKVLRRLGWRVTFATADGRRGAEEDHRRLERVGIEIADEPGIAGILRAHGAGLRLVHLYRHRIAALLLPRVRELAPRARVVFSPADLHFLREAREAALLGEDRADSVAATRAQEIGCARAADATIVLSDHERELLAAEVEPGRLHLLRWIVRPASSVPGFARRGGVLFVGHFGHAPNVDAVLWWARDIAPILARRRPGLVLDVVGADAPPALRALDGEAIQMRGPVPDLGALLDRTRLTVAPLRYGAGFKGKVATSLAAGVPVVGTPIAIEGTGLADGDGVAVAADAEAFANEVIRLHDESDAWEALSARALERVEALYSPVAADAVYGAMLRDLGLPVRQQNR